MDSSNATTNSRVPIHQQGEQGAIVFDTRLWQQADSAFFDPAHYGEAAKPVSGKGGRGAAWFVHGEFGDAVLRHYRRGGWAAKISDARYFWRDENSVRSVYEFHFMQGLNEKNLPVPKPIAAFFAKNGLFYRAAILVGRIPETRSFLDSMHRQTESAPWAQLGKTIARFHKAGAQHADLNAQNILIDPNDKIWLIDWDKAKQQIKAGPWCVDVLQRLQRSLLKNRGEIAAETIQAGMQVLRAAHDAELEK
ncbi:MAG: 3-deoxy-D-manno-octulosonic acid kinase [Arenimonas sp.]